MSRSVVPPEQWARAAAGWTDEFFALRVTTCDDPERLRAAVAYEAETRVRTDRIAKINQRLAALNK